MSRFSPQFLDELRGRTLLSALIGRGLKLTRAGREWKACCPFHHEKSPSFYVNDDKGFYHCFGCSAHGDAIRWMTDQQGLSFLDAVKELADNAGLALPAPDPRAAERDEAASKQHDVMAAAAEWFAGQLREDGGAEARAYLAKRGIKPATVDTFAMGFAPDRRDALKTALARFGDAALIETGLLISVEEKMPYDRFRGRLMIPIRDPRGRMIAFGGRILGTGEPKYLNSPDTPLFDKGRTLYNLDRAAPAARKAGRLIVVEGYMDVIALAQAGIGEVVAPLGTALTEAQLERLWRQLDVPVMCFDGDGAGRKAAVKAAYRALPIIQAGQSAEFVGLPPGEDPDDVIRRDGAVGFEEQMKARTSLHQLIYAYEKSLGDMEKPEDRAGVRVRLDSLAATASSQYLAAEFRRTFSSMFFDEFGWKPKHRKAIGSAILRTGPRGNQFLFNLYIRSALYGLTRYPLVIGSSLESVARVPIDHPDLSRWRGALMEVGIEQPKLEYDGVAAILDAAQLSMTQRFDLQKDLRFGFTQVALEASKASEAMTKLAFLIDFLGTEQEHQLEMARLNAAIVADTTLEHYLALEAQRQVIREEQLKLRERSVFNFEQDLV